MGAVIAEVERQGGCRVHGRQRSFSVSGGKEGSSASEV